MEKSDLLSLEDYENFKSKVYCNYIDKNHMRMVRDDSDIVIIAERSPLLIREGECLYGLIYFNYPTGELITELWQLNLTFFKVRNVTYVLQTKIKVINSFYNSHEDKTSITGIVNNGILIPMRTEGEEVVRYIDRQGNVVRLWYWEIISLLMILNIFEMLVKIMVYYT